MNYSFHFFSLSGISSLFAHFDHYFEHSFQGRTTGNKRFFVIELFFVHVIKGVLISQA